MPPKTGKKAAEEKAREEKKALGRPRYTIEELIEKCPDWDYKMREIAQDGGSEVSVIVHLGITRNNFETLIADSDIFSQTVKECKELCKHWWEECGKKLAKGEWQGNAAVYIFNMKNRFGWRDRIEMSTDPDAPFQLGSPQKQLTKEELIEECRAKGLPLTMFEKVVGDDE